MTADDVTNRVVGKRSHYEGAGQPHGVPWYVVGIIH